MSNEQAKIATHDVCVCVWEGGGGGGGGRGCGCACVTSRTGPKSPPPNANQQDCSYLAKRTDVHQPSEDER